MSIAKAPRRNSPNALQGAVKFIEQAPAVVAGVGVVRAGHLAVAGAYAPVLPRAGPDGGNYRRPGAATAPSAAAAPNSNVTPLLSASALPLKPTMSNQRSVVAWVAM